LLKAVQKYAWIQKLNSIGPGIGGANLQFLAKRRRLSVLVGCCRLVAQVR
jgi:hypothetical protein